MRPHGRVLVPTLLLVVSACGGGAPPDSEENPAEVAATSRHGSIRCAAIEPAVRAAVAGEPADETEALVDAYRRVAEDRVVELALLGSSDGRERALEALGEEREKVHRDAVVDLYLQESLRPDLSVSEAEIHAYYEAHRERFHRPAQRQVWHLFRRHEDPAHPEATVAFVEGLRQRILAGASFADLAREHSQSETRLLGGRLGVVAPGKLPPKLEAIVFGLAANQLSAPISTRQGVFLFRIGDVIPEKDFPVADMRLTIAREVREQKVRQALAAAAGDEPLPPEARVLDAEALRRVPALGEEEVALEVGGYRLTVAELREALAERRHDAPPSLEPERDMEHFYEALVLRQRLFLKAEREGFVERRRAAVETLERHLGSERWLRRELERRMEEKVDRAEEERRRFYDDNSYLYQTPLRLKLRILQAPLGSDPAARLARLEALREELSAGDLDLEQAAQAIGGVTRDLGWSGAATLGSLEPKVRYYLLDMSGTGYTIPFQANRQLSLIQVEAREEPRERPYEEVADPVRRDYLERHRQELYRQVIDEILAAADFRFHREAVLARLGTATPAAGS